MMSGSLSAAAAAARAEVDAEAAAAPASASAASNGEIAMTSSGSLAGNGNEEENGRTWSGGCFRGGGVCGAGGGDGGLAKKEPNASAGIGGLPQESSWSKLKVRGIRYAIGYFLGIRGLDMTSVLILIFMKSVLVSMLDRY